MFFLTRVVRFFFPERKKNHNPLPLQVKWSVPYGSNGKVKNKIYSTVEIVPTFNRQIVEKGKMDTTNTEIQYMIIHFLFLVQALL